MADYDVIIIGAGSAGMPAAIYAQRFGMKTLLIGKIVGGMLNDSHNVENYPGFPSIPGFDLMMKFKEHVDSLNIQFKEEEATGANRNEDGTISVTTNKSSYNTRAVIITTGSKHRHVGIPGEEELSGKGVSYCATCDAAFFKDVPVAIVGGGDAAAQAANLLSQHSSHVYVLVRRDVMRAEPINREKLEKNPKVDILYETKPTEVLGDSQVTGVKLTKEFNGSDTLPIEGFFVEIGADALSDLAFQLGAKINEQKEIIIDSESRTSAPMVYAAGDCGNRKFKQAITGAAEGVIAAFSAFEDIQKKNTGKTVEISYH